MVVLTSDHGESFERGVSGHGGPATHEALIWIPLLMHLPGVPPTRVQTFAEQLDLAPTILSYLSLPVPSAMKGESLIPYIREPSKLSLKPRVVLSNHAVTYHRGQVSVLYGRFKLTFLREDRSVHRLYDIVADPSERHDLSSQYPALLDRLLRLVRLP